MVHIPIVKHFDELTIKELYEAVRLRNQVFVVEQNCPYQDADGKDMYCHHILLLFDGRLEAYARLVPPGISYKEMSIRRVVTSKTYRRNGTGKLLVQQCIANCFRLFGPGPIRISAQVYIKEFYNYFGFQTVGPVYDEDGIPHIQMIRNTLSV